MERGRILRFSKRGKTVAIYFSLLVLLIVTLFPIYWTFITSLKTRGEIWTGVTYFPGEITGVNYINAFIEGPHFSYLVNSLVIASVNTLLVLLFALPAAYVFSRHKVPGHKHLFFWLITNRMAAPAIFVLPLFIMATTFGILDTHPVLIVTYLLFNLPFAIWLLKGMIDAIPKEVDDAASVDGCSIWGIFRHVIIPLAKPGIVVTGLLVWLFAWNEYIFASILTGTRVQTITLGLYTFVTKEGLNYGGMAAVTMVCLIPPILLLLLVQRHIVRGLTFGAVGG